MLFAFSVAYSLDFWGLGRGVVTPGSKIEHPDDVALYSEYPPSPTWYAEAGTMRIIKWGVDSEGKGFIVYDFEESPAAYIKMDSNNIYFYDTTVGSEKTLSQIAAGTSYAPADASYIVVNTNGDLTGERYAYAGDGIETVDEGSNGKFTFKVSVRNTGGLAFDSGKLYVKTRDTGGLNLNTGGLGIADTIPGDKTFSGNITFSNNITIPETPSASTDAASKGYVDSVSGGAPIGVSYLVLGLNSTLTNERVFTDGDGISVSDGGANGNYTVSVDADSTKGMKFSGGKLYLSVKDVGGLDFDSGDLYVKTRDTGGLNIDSNGLGIDSTIPGDKTFSGNITFSNNITIPETPSASTDAASKGYVDSVSGDAPVGVSYLVLGLDSTLTNERVFSAGDGISVSDGGANGNYTVSVDVDSTKGMKFSGGKLYLSVRNTGGLDFDSGDLYVKTKSDGGIKVNASNELQIDTDKSYVITTMTITIDSPASVGTNKGSFPMVVPVAMKIDEVYLKVGTAPGTDKTFTIDVNKNGTTLFTTQGNRPSLTGSETSDSTTPDVVSLSKNDLITVDVDVSTSGTSVAKAILFIRCKQKITLGSY